MQLRASEWIDRFGATVALYEGDGSAAPLRVVAPEFCRRLTGASAANIC